jgi:hypothetical protein
MALNWRVGEIKNYKKVCYRVAPADIPYEGIKKGELVMRQECNRLIWATMNVDLGSITAKNIDEWAFRLNVLYDIGLSAFPKPLTKAELKKYIGLSTNVSTKTRRQFMKKISDHIARKAQEYVENPRRKKTKKRKR